jgi:protein gp37
MGQNTSIEWTDHTFNPWWGCVKVSPGCANCYAETWAKRYGNDLWGRNAPRRTFSEAHWNDPIKWNKQAVADGVRRRVFCASMSDVFEDHPAIAGERERLWTLIGKTPALDWLLLTKRPENMQRFAPWQEGWPNNVWAMTSVENQAVAVKRIPVLLDVPARIRGLSVEPLLGPLDLTPWLNGIHWVIVGGESGPNARPMHTAWVTRIQRDCRDAGVAFFFKQWGAWSPLRTETDLSIAPETFMVKVGKGNAGRTLQGRTWDELPRADGAKRNSQRIGLRPLKAV